MRYTQSRKGPLFSGLGGLLQAFSDALKIINKSEFLLLTSNLLFYWLFPFFRFFFMLTVWLFFSNIFGSLEIFLSCLLFLCLISLLRYGLIYSGWSSNSKYSLLGGLRGVAQSVSYELLIFLGFLVLFSVFKSYNFFFLKNFFFFLFLFFIYLILVLSLVCEVNRSPFDLSEGESELVRGFNVEYGGLKFALIFLSEYGIIIFISFVLSLVLRMRFSMILLILLVWMLLFILLRSSYPRVRFDYLIMLSWKQLSIFVSLGFMFYILIL